MGCFLIIFCNLLMYHNAQLSRSGRLLFPISSKRSRSKDSLENVAYKTELYFSFRDLVSAFKIVNLLLRIFTFDTQLLFTSNVNSLAL